MPQAWLRTTGASLVVVPVALLATWSATDQQAERPKRVYTRVAQVRPDGKVEFFGRLPEIPQLPPGAPPQRAVVVKRQAQATITYEDPAEDDEPAEEAPAQPRRILARDNFDRWIFGDIDERERIERLEVMLAGNIERAARYNGLTPAHRARLLLAGRGDLKRFFDRVAEKRAEFEVARKDTRAGLRLLQQLYPEQSDYQKGPFGLGSLYDKMLNKILAEDPSRQRPIPTILDR